MTDSFSFSAPPVKMILTDVLTLQTFDFLDLRRALLRNGRVQEVLGL